MKQSIDKYDFKQGLPQEFEILTLSHLFDGFADELTSPHRTEFYQVFWFQEGSPEHMVDFSPVKIKPNTLLFVNKNAVQCFDRNHTVEGKSILFTDNFFCKTEADIRFLKNSILFNDLHSISQIQLSKSSEPFNGLFQQFETELSLQKDDYQSDVLRNFLRNFLLLAERERRKQDFVEVKKGADLDYVMHFKELLESTFTSQKLVGKYASQINVTEKRLNQATSKVLGKSPKHMIDERVMLEAKRLLAYTSESVKEIGFELGFEEPTNFVKYFRKHHQNTPISFREEFIR